jgi:tetratricopeptide (TPR) repeat protein
VSTLFRDDSAPVHPTGGDEPDSRRDATARAYERIQQGNFREAIGLVDELLATDPTCFDALRLGGTAHLLLGERRKAIALLRQALRHQPDNAEVLSNLGAALREEGALEEAIEILRRAVTEQPNNSAALLNLGSALCYAYKLDESVAVCEKALAVDPSNAKLYHNLGSTLLEAGRVAHALSCFERALAISPDQRETLDCLTHVLLLVGDFHRGWRAHESRFVRESYRNWRGLIPSAPKWDGNRPANGRVMLVAEQGHGDAMQFVRYAHLLIEAGLRPSLQCHPRLVKLLASSGYFDAIVPFGTPLADANTPWFPLLSMPLIAGTELSTIPARVPYLYAERKLASRWGALFAGDSSLRVGIAWQGNPKAETGILRDRSIPAREFAPLAAIPNVKLICLQKGFGIEQLRTVDFASRIIAPDLDVGADGYLDTAALMTQLDLIVTSDTSIAHLAGALGRPVWVALKHSPDWRWLLHRTDSPWYPTMRLFRQSRPGSWDAVFRQIGQEISTLQPRSNPGDACPA